MDVAQPVAQAQGKLDVTRPTTDTLCIRLAGEWTIHAELPTIEAIQSELDAGSQGQRVVFETPDLTDWDSALLTFLLKLMDLCAQRQVECDLRGLPKGVQRLVALAKAVPEHHESRRQDVPAPLLERVGESALAIMTATHEFFTFVGQLALAFGQLVRGRARFRRVDLMLIIQESGAQALPIVALISFLVGMILAFVGATQLRPFGAQIYVANLVALGMAREMGAMMTGVIMAGRTGAAFAAQLGTMTVNQEIDALTTMGLTPMEFLVVPRMLALMLMMPLLCIYADLIGILGGAIVGVGVLRLEAAQYYQQTLQMLHLNDFIAGLIKGTVFGGVVALSGCLRGMQCGRSASAVGAATTSSMVTAIVWIVIWDALLTVMYNILEM